MLTPHTPAPTAITPDRIPIAAVIVLLTRLIGYYRQFGIEAVDLSANDFYRVFATDQMFDVYADTPSPISIGSLHDDIMELSKHLADPDRMPTPLDLERLGNLLRAMSEAL